MKKTDHIPGLPLIVLVLILLSGCGGSGGSSNPPVTITPDGLLDQVPGIGDLGDITDLVNAGTGTAGTDNSGTGTTGTGTTGFPTPLVRTLNWPVDFPADIKAGLTDTILVNGLPTRSAYDFDVTLPALVDSDDTALFVMNLSEDQQVGGQVCTGDPDCTGTVNYATVSLQLVSFDSGTASIAITPSSSRALINEGSVNSPVKLMLSGDQLSYEGSVGAAAQTAQQIVSGKSHYLLEGLTAGSRYKINLANETDNDIEMTVNYAVGVDAQCDPSYSGTSRCVLVADDDALEFQVEGVRSIFGAGFTIEVSKLADATDFEGTWHTPVALPVADTDIVYHFGHSDQYSSFYSLTGLDPERRYRILLSGNTAPVRLKLNSPTTSLPVSSPQCRAVAEDNSSGEQVCVIENAMYTYFRVESVDAPANYLLSIDISPQDEGSQASPIPLQLDAQSRVLHNGSVIGSSSYRVQGLTAGKQYLAQSHGAAWPLQMTLLNSASAEVSCDSSGRTYCMFTATEATVDITIADSGSEFGEHFIVSLLPIDPSDTRNPAPAAENLALLAASLPHTGTVDDFYSNYSVSGLAPNQIYLVHISHNSEVVDLSAWPGQATTISCRVTVRETTGSGCQVQADANGVMNVRIGGNVGGQFQLNLLNSAPAGDYVSADTPVVIPDHSEPGATSTINVADNGLVDVVEVVLQIDHGYTRDLEISLQAPDGQVIKLADHVPGVDFSGTVFSDFAALPNPSSESFYYHSFKRYRPDSALHNLHGINKSGDWTLHVTDSVYTNRSDALGGTLTGWGLRFSSLPE